MSDQAEIEIFGGQDAFTERWTNGVHQIPRVLPASPQARIPRDVRPYETLSECLETGVNNHNYPVVQYIIDSTPDKNFRIAMSTGLVPTLMLDHAMKSNRIDTPSNAMKEGFTPQGIAQWLVKDQETRRALKLLFELQGYRVASEEDIDGNPIHDIVDPAHVSGLPSFSQFNRLDGGGKMMLRSEHIIQYLRAVQSAVEVDSPTGSILSSDTTDWGIVRVAYTIFRGLGFGHGNPRIAEQLAGKYAFKSDGTGDLVAKFDGTGKDADIAPIIDKFRDPFDRNPDSKSQRTLADVLRTQGVLGFARSLNALPAETIARYWGDWQLIVDVMDKLYDIRAGIGGAATMSPDERIGAVKAIQELNPALAKRKFSDETAHRLLDPKRITYARGSGAPSRLDNELAAIRHTFRIGKRPKSVNK